MSIEDDIALLSQVPSFSALGRQALRVLAIGAESRTLQPGEVLFREGEAADGGYVVEEGALSAVTDGRQAQPLTLERGTLIGEMALIAETRRAATVTAERPSSVMRIPRPLFLKMLQGYPDVAERLRRVLLARTQEMADALALVRVAIDPGEVALPPGSQQQAGETVEPQVEAAAAEPADVDAAEKPDESAKA